MDSVYSEELKCNFMGIKVEPSHNGKDSQSTELSIVTPKFHTASMDGCISFAKKIMPKVEKINVVWPDGVIHTIYYYHRGQWNLRALQ